MNTRQTLILVPVLGVFAFLFYSLRVLVKSHEYNSCQSNLKRIGLALKQYERDYDEKMMQSHNWRTVLEPYRNFYKNKPMFNCPDPNFGYAFNAYLSGVSEQQIGNFKSNQYKTTPTVFDSTSTQLNAADFGTSYVANGAHSIWKRGRGTNVLFFDCHVKWMQKKPVFQAIKPIPVPFLPDPWRPKPAKTRAAR